MSVPPDLAYGQGLAGRAWQVGKPLWIRDVGQPQSLISEETAATGRLHTALAIPVRHGLEPLGVLTAFADTVEDPEDEVVALMSGIAAHIGQFVERRLVEDLQRQLARSENEYLALVGHEMRTPLTAISAYTEILRESDPAVLAADGPAMLEVIERNTAQLRQRWCAPEPPSTAVRCRSTPICPTRWWCPATAGCSGRSSTTCSATRSNTARTAAGSPCRCDRRVVPPS
jgi:hypothetical protein